MNITIIILRGTNFNSRASCGARLETVAFVGVTDLFQLTCPVRGTTSASLRLFSAITISTHVPRAGHDCAPSAKLTGFSDFNSRAPCGARRLALGRVILVCGISTHVPRAGHDRHAKQRGELVAHFNSRAPCGARPFPRQMSRCSS